MIMIDKKIIYQTPFLTPGSRPCKAFILKLYYFYQVSKYNIAIALFRKKYIHEII